MKETIIAAIVLALILGAAILYIYKAKKRGVKCIGCPDSGKCSGNCASCSSCSGCAHKN